MEITPLIQQIWMEQGENTTLLRYMYPEGGGEISLTLKGMLSYSNFHHTNKMGANYQVDHVNHGVKVTAADDATPYYLLSGNASPRILKNVWLPGFFLAEEDYRGLDALADYYNGVDFQAVLKPGDEISVIVSTNESVDLSGRDAYLRRKSLDNQLLEISNMSDAPENIQQQVFAANQFIVRRDVKGEPGHSVIAGYPWFSDWGRDTMIALPGLTLATSRYDVAESILQTFAKFVDQGMLPNRFPDIGEQPEYNTIDATLWYFEAV
ncbi:MAG: amylo-alpha-1,6-glucosidase, partial [Anaerolineales bacterium]